MDQSNNKSQTYWKSLSQLNGDADFIENLEKEFLKSPVSEAEAGTNQGRRDFFKLMAASVALGTTSCMRPVQKLVPYFDRPEEIIPGLPNYYSSVFVDGGEVYATVTKTREGRPIKLEGNPEFGVKSESSTARMQAAVLSLYDPDRLKAPVKNLLNSAKSNRDTVATSWVEIDKEAKKALKSGKSALLMGHVPSPTTRKLVSEWAATNQVEVYSWDQLNYSKLKSARKTSYGTHELPGFDFTKAKFVLSLNCDFLGTFYGALKNQVQFAQTRTPDQNMSKLVQVESLMSLTGTNADERLQIAPSEQVGFLKLLMTELNSTHGLSWGGAVQNTVIQNYFSTVESVPEVSSQKIKEWAQSLVDHRGESLVISGGAASETSEATWVYQLVNAINSALGNEGKTVFGGSASVTSYHGEDVQLKDLIQDINSGKVKSLFIYDTNPVYTAPNSDFKKAMTQLKTAFAITNYHDETAQLCNYVIAADHSFETWRDAQWDNSEVAIGQPTIRPLYDTRSFEDNLLKWSGSSQTWDEYFLKTWKSKSSNWNETLQKGVWKKSALVQRAGSFKGVDAPKSKAPVSELEFVAYETVAMKTGSMNNVSWLQELPDPVTKVCWDNYFTISPDYAKKMKLTLGKDLELSVNGEKLKAPVLVQPGQNNKTIGLALGYGRTSAGELGSGVGVNAAQFLKNNLSSGLAVESANIPGSVTPLACVQDHHSMEGRQIVVEASLGEITKDPKSGQHKHKIFSLWGKHKYPGYRWGMSVDLNSCNGCSACMVACQSENNIPVVGKKHVLNGREMHWIRIDRYYAGDEKNPRVVHQPVMCQHCENAPCETVCPVLATVHSSEGMNDMVYNRCVGTRYCANNCPYKVRRFNWFNYSQVKFPEKLKLNPEVTVRSRGVMEKCTFCVQKVKEAKSKASLQKRKLRTNEVKTACQTACPAQAISFGDLNNPESLVVQNFNEPRTYSLLEELNVGPAVKYMSKVRNISENLNKSHHGKAHHGDEAHSAPAMKAHDSKIEVHKKESPTESHSPDHGGGH